MSKSKAHDVFISYAEPDSKLAKLLHDLFEDLGISAYFAPEELRTTPHDWEKGLTHGGLKQCAFFVPIFSKHSIDRKWVLFEAGAAMSLGMKVFATRTEGITREEVQQFPGAHRLQQFSLYDRGDIKVLFQQIGELKYGKDKTSLDDFTRRVNALFNETKPSSVHANWLNELVCQARKRWVFIAGNTSQTLMSPAKQVADEFHDFVRELTIRLFQAGYHLSACPQVTPVGRVVFDTAEELIASHSFCDVNGCEVDYEIAGIYPVDEQLRKSPILNKDLEDQWKRHLMKFRRSYLENKDWLVIIGGNAGTMDEFQAVKDINKDRSHSIKTCVVSYFGGTGKELTKDPAFHKHPQVYFDGCKDWKDGDGLEKLAKLVAELIQHH